MGQRFLPLPPLTGKRYVLAGSLATIPASSLDRNARWGWDSFHEIWVYGYGNGIHALVEVKSELPLILSKLTGANTHDE